METRDEKVRGLLQASLLKQQKVQEAEKLPLLQNSPQL